MIRVFCSSGVGREISRRKSESLQPPMAGGDLALCCHPPPDLGQPQGQKTQFLCFLALLLINRPHPQMEK